MTTARSMFKGDVFVCTFWVEVEARDMSEALAWAEDQRREMLEVEGAVSVEAVVSQTREEES